jgi:hypothetical protein
MAAGGWEWYRGGLTLLATAILVAGLAMFCALALALRTGTPAGPLGEVRQYVSPALRLSGPGYYFQWLLGEYWPLVLAAVAGVPALMRARPRGTAYSTRWATVVPAGPGACCRCSAWSNPSTARERRDKALPTGAAAYPRI